VYAVAGRPDLAAKVYDRPPADLGPRLAAMTAGPPAGLLDLSAPAAVAWPLDALVGANGQVVGLLVPRLTGRTGFGELVNPATRPPGVGFDILVRAARNLAAAVAGLHAAGVVAGDLNPNNALVGPAGEVALIDAESAQVPGPAGPYRCPVGMPDLTPPEGQGVPFGSADLRPTHDLFGLGVLAFMAFMDGNHPFAGTPARGGAAAPVSERIKRGWWPHARRSPYRPRRQAPPFAGLPAEVQTLFRQCFEAGHASPLARPSAATWVDVLDRVLAGPVAPPAATPAVPARVPATGVKWERIREWAARRWEPVRRRPRAAAAVMLAAAAGGAGVWWWQMSKQPPGPGGKPTPALWQELRRERR
jgi:DNA-binding helix-hairpin-helix protein with protein kinase domain